MSQPPVNGPYSQPGQPGQYSAPAQQNPYGQAGVPGPQAQYGQASQAAAAQYGHPGPQAQYGQQAGQPAETQAASYGVAGAQQSSSAPQYEYQPSRLGPIPVEQDRLVLKPTATTASRIQFLVGGGFGLVCLVAAVKELLSNGPTVSFVVLLLLGLVLLLGVLFLMSVRTVFDATGIHIGAGGRGRDIPWPRSRTGLFVKVPGAPAALGVAAGKVQIRHAEGHVVDPAGKAFTLAGLTWSGVSAQALEAKGTAELDRIWEWAVARGYTQETGEYVELNGVLGVQQGLRARQERRQGLNRP